MLRGGKGTGMHVQRVGAPTCFLTLSHTFRKEWEGGQGGIALPAESPFNTDAPEQPGMRQPGGWRLAEGHQNLPRADSHSGYAAMVRAASTTSTSSAAAPPSPPVPLLSARSVSEPAPWQSGAESGSSALQSFHSIDEQASRLSLRLSVVPPMEVRDTSGGTADVPAAVSRGPLLSRTLPALDNPTLLQELLERDLCKVCFERVANVAFLPCGHLGVCEICAAKLDRCPVDRTPIAGRLKVIRL